MNVTFESIFAHEYFLAIYGVVIWYSIVRELARREFMKKQIGKPKPKRFDGKQWRKDNMGSFLVTALIAPLVIVFDDEIVGVINGFIEDDISMGKYIYLIAGPITDGLFRLVTQYKKKQIPL